MMMFMIGVSSLNRNVVRDIGAAALGHALNVNASLKILESVDVA